MTEKLKSNFEFELKKLGFKNLDVNLVEAGASKGIVSTKLVVSKNSKVTEILSEGEQKVIAIADFLAEMQLSEVNKGIIFDDPVTSLDNDRKKQIAERLAFQATLKQVIIFTHDLVFFYHIKII